MYCFNENQDERIHEIEEAVFEFLKLFRESVTERDGRVDGYAYTGPFVGRRSSSDYYRNGLLSGHSGGGLVS